MFGLNQLFYPWGLILQGIALVHFVRRRPDNFWFFVIFFGSFLGAAVYIVVEVIPDASLLRDFFQRFGRRSRIDALETQILDNPSAGNYEELGELLWDQKEYARAKDALTHSISVRDDSPHAFYLRAQSSLALNDFAAAIPDLEHVVSGDRKFDYYRAAGLLANAYVVTGKFEAAAPLYDDVTQFSTTPETLYNYANYLKMLNRLDEARDWTRKLMEKKRTLPRYMQRRERAWFSKGKALHKELAQPEIRK
jgi:hypothetical protein